MRRGGLSCKQLNKMGYKPVLPLLMSMAFPPMLSMLIQSLYNIVDSMFVAQIGEDALTAVSLAFPIQTLIVACSVGIGVGVNSYIARKLGEQNQKEANSAVAHGLLLSLICCLSQSAALRFVRFLKCLQILRQYWMTPVCIRMSVYFCALAVSFIF